MNVIKFPEPQKALSEEEKFEIARQELLAEVRRMEAQGLLTFDYIEQQPGEVIQLSEGGKTDQK
jgi:hypothetical protein